MDDRRVGRIVRALRHRRGWRQSDLAARSGSTQSTVSLIERGRLEEVTLRRIRRTVAVLDGELVVLVRWRGGDLDRLLDERHARLAGHMARLLTDSGWAVQPEVTYSIYGERGSIDLVATHDPTGNLLVVEIKSELVSVEETLRRLDAKVRLAPGIASVPSAASRLLVLPESRTVRRAVERHAAIFDRALPVRNVEARRRIRVPGSSVTAWSGLLFLPVSDAIVRRRVRVQRRGRDRVGTGPSIDEVDQRRES